MKSSIMIMPGNRLKINALIKRYARTPEKFTFPIISQDDAVTELIRFYEEHTGVLLDIGTPADMKGPLESIRIIGAEGM